METLVRLKTENDKIIRISGDDSGVSVQIQDKDGICLNEQRRPSNGDVQRDNRQLFNFNKRIPTLYRDLRLHDIVQVTAKTDTGKLIILEVLPPEKEQNESPEQKGLSWAEEDCEDQRPSDDPVRETLGLVLRYRNALKLSVKINADKDITLHVPPFQTIEYVKRMIQCKEGIPWDMQRLIFAGNVLFDQLSLNELSIVNGSQLVLSVITPDDMEISVCTAADNVFKVRVKPCDTIDMVKNKIQCTSGFPTDQQQLMYAGKRLIDTRFVGDYNIQKDSTLQLFLHQQDEIQVIITTVTGRTMPLTVHPMDTVTHVKTLIGQLADIPTKDLFLIFNHRPLQSDGVLCAIGITNNSNVTMMLPLRTGHYFESHGYLKKEKTLADYNIVKEHTLNLIVKFKSCSVRIDTLANEMVMSKRHRFPTENIGTVKARILDTEDAIRADKRCVNILDGEPRTCCGFNLTQEHCIHLVLHFREGMQIRVKTNITGPIKLEHSTWESDVK